MASTSTGNSKRLNVATATAVAGVVLAASISVGTLLGLVKPAEAGGASGQTSIAAQAKIPVAAPSTAQVVLVPVAPTPPQSATVDLNPPAADRTRPSSDSGEASRSPRGDGERRPAIVRATTGERDDD